jgi:polyhydroxybutyrate depolymerase
VEHNVANPEHSRRTSRSIARAGLASLLLVAVASVAACGGSSATDGGVRPEAAPVPSGSDPDTTDSDASSTEVAAEPSPGCAAGSTAAALDDRRTIAVDGAERWYLWTAPEHTAGATPMPLVLDFHGLAEGAEFHGAMSGFAALAQSERFALAVPNGTGNPVSWGIAADGSNRDVAFVEALIDEIAATTCIDLRRIHATGLSNGALLSSALACTLSDRIASIAAVAGLSDPPGCSPVRPVPVLAYHGTDDAILLFNGGVGDLGAALQGGTPTIPPGTTADLDGPGTPAAVRAWAARNGCDATPEDSRAGSDVLRRSYRCPEGADVEFLVIEGGGHSWPGSDVSRSLEQVVGRTTMELDATSASWQFFREHPRSDP